MKNLITHEISEFVKEYRNASQPLTEWDTPLACFADANDPLFFRLKEVVSPSHLMPSDLLEKARTVISYFVPFEKGIPLRNRHGFHASREWAIAYVETNRLIVEINLHLSDILAKNGFETIILPPTHNFDKEALISDWSHKHIAYIAGLGNFGIHHLLITDRGCCGRLGSIVTDARIEPTPRTGAEHCLFRHDGSCGKCVEKCVCGALGTDSFDRRKCYDILLENAALHEDAGLADVCGKCACIVPCSFQNPVKNAKG